MFGLKKKGGPIRQFSHATDCKILKADPGVEIPWNEVESGHWVAECRCGKEYYRDPVAARSARSARPLDVPPRAAVRAPGYDRFRSHQGHPPCEARPRGRLLVGHLQHLRHLLAGAPLWRGEHRVRAGR
jgi:hypothetical protein